MSDVRSWDRWADRYQTFTNSKETPEFNTPVRVVEWPEGAPPQSGVPHAGERVKLVDHYDHYYQNEGWIVVNGIPEGFQDTWRLQVVLENDPTEKALFPLEIIRPDVKSEESQTFTEEEIRGAAHGFFSTYATVDNLIGNLKREAAK